MSKTDFADETDRYLIPGTYLPQTVSDGFQDADDILAWLHNIGQDGVTIRTDTYHAVETFSGFRVYRNGYVARA